MSFLASCNKKSKSPQVPPGGVEIKDTVLTEGLSNPWEILWGPDNYIWMTELGGRISRVNPTTGAVTPLLTISEVVANNEGGMLGMVLHPDFSTNPYLYVAYDYQSNGYKGKVVRYTYSGGA